MERQTRSQTVNNAFYDELGEGWYDDIDHPIALLRAENKVRIPWIIGEIDSQFKRPVAVLDVGCGAGLLTNALAVAGHLVSGIDLSETSLETARRHDQTGQVRYRVANAYSLPFADASFDVVCATDVLEHVEEPHRLIAEASRVLKPNGLFFFHTFNRNPLSYLVIIKGVDWFVRNAPKHMHVYSLFIKPKELRHLCLQQSLHVQSIVGFRPIVSLPLFRMIFTRRVPPNFSFRFSKSLATGYCGFAQKQI
jgi:2-polyprenyl-6-hydroxyphenyl methylase/3-demethylubiquinone-9 3-methyltransferase